MTGGCDDVNGGPARQTLSGDVVLPSQPQPGGELVVIDSGNSVLNFVMPASCAPKHTAAVTGMAIVSSDYAVSSVALYDPAAGTLIDDCVHSGMGGVAAPRAQLSVSTGGFKAHPHDVVGISAHKAYVTRYETNASPTADTKDFDEGDDLLIVDPENVKVLGRISLSAYATADESGTATQARPDRAVLVDGLVYVTLNSISGDFGATGPGRVVVVDPTTDAVTSTIDLPKQKNCSGINHVAKKLYVSCGGVFGDPNQVAQSALVEIDVSGTMPVLGRIIQATALAGQPINLAYAAVLGDTAFVGTLGALDPKTGAVIGMDAFYAVALDSGPPVKLIDGGAFNLGRAIVDSATMKVLVPDGSATMPRVQIWDASAGMAATPFEANPAGHLPPREIARY